jgi:serine/threonine protein kinase
VESSKHILIVMENCAGGDLLHFVKRKGKLPEAEAKIVFRQIVYGARVCHTSNVLHRDFKLDNILLDEDLTTAKICDFGVSKFVKRGQIIDDQCGTPAYIAPEIVADQGYEGFTVDIWSLGVLLYAIVCGTVPFKASTMNGLHKLILRGKYDFPEHLSSEVKDLIDGMLQIVPQQRLSVKQILDHPWFSATSTDELNRAPRFVGKPDCDLARHGFLDDRVQIDMKIIDKVVELGFTKEFIVQSL